MVAINKNVLNLQAIKAAVTLPAIALLNSISNSTANKTANKIPRRRPLMRLKFFSQISYAMRLGFGADDLLLMSRSDAIIRFGIGAVKLAENNLTPVLFEDASQAGVMGMCKCVGMCLALRSDGRFELLLDDTIGEREYLNRPGYVYNKSGVTITRKPLGDNPGNLRVELNSGANGQGRDLF